MSGGRALREKLSISEELTGQFNTVSNAMFFAICKAFGAESNRLIKEKNAPNLSSLINGPENMRLTPADMDALFQKVVDGMSDDILFFSNADSLVDSANVQAQKIFSELSPEDQRVLFDYIFPSAVENSGVFPAYEM